MLKKYNSDIFNSFIKSIKRFNEILNAPQTLANRDSAIKRFELTFELAWKSIKEYLDYKGIISRSPRDCFEQAFSIGIIQDDPAWIKMIEDRNLSVHTYNEKLAMDIYRRLGKYLNLFKSLSKSLRAKK
ncbi:MAG: nucleotidyltransferase substrate binding protein [Elusimicrobia bacterium]|nr:nucleotidyltransferase substrate binding protein [Elusimicrobiota bacterium]